LDNQTQVLTEEISLADGPNLDAGIDTAIGAMAAWKCK
jgi:hypothetical protein